MLDRKAFPRPFPSWAPFTRPAISTMLRKAGTLLKRTNNYVSKIGWVAVLRPSQQYFIMSFSTSQALL